MMGGVLKKDYKHKVVGLIPDCFSGREAVGATGINGASQAVQACKDMLELNLIRHVLGEKAFENSVGVMYMVTPVGNRFLRSSPNIELWSIELGELTSRDQADGLIDVCRQMIHDLELRDRVGMKRKQTFLGCEAVDWVCFNTGRQRRLDATGILSEMLRCGMLKAVDNAHEVEFSDSSAIYQGTVGPATMEDFDVIASLPMGCLPEVTYGSYKKCARQVAFFTVEKSRKDSCAAAAAQFRRVVHPNIVRVLHSMVHDRSFVVVTDRGSASFVEALLASQSWSEAIISHAMHQVCSALAILHDSGLVYASLSPQSLILSAGGTLESMPPIKLTFADSLRSAAATGSSKLGLSSTAAINGSYAAPESGITPASDLFSLGALLHVLLCGSLPFNVTAEGLEMSQAAWDVVSEGAQILVKTLLRFDPKQRPSAAMAELLPWFSDRSCTADLDTAFSALRSMMQTSRSARAVRSGTVGTSPTERRSERRNSLLKRSDGLHAERKASIGESGSRGNRGRASSSGQSVASGSDKAANLIGAITSRMSTGSPSSLSPHGDPLEKGPPIHVVVITRMLAATVSMFQKITEPLSPSDLGTMVMASGEDGNFGSDLHFIFVDLEEVFEPLSNSKKLLWHPAFTGAHLVMLVDSICAALDDKISSEAVAVCRSLFQSEFLAPAPIPVPIVVALSELVEFRKALVRDKLLGTTDVESSEYQQRENRLILSITDRFDHIDKSGTRPFQVVLLPSMDEKSARKVSQSELHTGAATAATIGGGRDSFRPQDGRRSFATRKSNPAATLQDIGARYSALAPTALTEAGDVAVRKSIYECVIKTAGSSSRVPKEMLAQIDSDMVLFRSSHFEESPRAALKSVPEWLQMLSLCGGSVEQSAALIGKLPLGLVTILLKDYALSGAVCETLGNFVKKSSKLRTLTLHQCGMKSEELGKLLVGVAPSQTLAVLDVSYNDLGDEGMERLADSVILSVSLERIHARKANVNAKGLAAWKNVLRMCHWLQLLDLSENPSLGHAHPEIQLLLGALKENMLSSLHTLLVSPPLATESREVFLERSKGLARYSSDLARYQYLQQLGKVPAASVDLSFCRLFHLPWDCVAVSFIHVTVLNVSWNSFVTIPTVVCSMLLLEEFIAIGSKISALPVEFGSLKRLRRLSLARNALTAVPDEVCTALEALEYLDLRFNQISELPSSIQNLVSLKYLYVQNNRIVSLPASIFSLKNVVDLHCEGNPMNLVLVEVYRQFATRSATLDLTGLGIYGLPPEVGMLSRVTEVILAHNNLSWLPPQLADMPALVALDISHNRFERLPPCIGDSALMVFKCDNNPMTHVAKALLASPLRNLITSAKAQDVLEKVLPLNRLRCFLVGDRSTGKTTLANRLCQIKAGTGSLADHVVNVRPWSADGIEFSIWDFGGASCTDMFPLFSADASVYLLCVSLDTDMGSVTQARLWLENLRVSVPKSSVIIVGTHADVVNQTSLSLMEAKFRELIQHFSQVKGYVMSGINGAGSPSSTGNGEVAAKILVAARALIRDRPMISEAVRELEQAMLVQREIRSPPLMTKTEFTAIAARHKVVKVDSTLKVLHELGTLFVCFGDSPFIVLDPMWLSNLLGLLYTSLFRISSIMKEEWLSKSHFKQMWDSWKNVDAGAAHSQELYLSLLCDLSVSCRIGDLYTVPMLLADERPTWLWHHVGPSSQFESSAASSLVNNLAPTVANEMRRIFSVKLVWYGMTARLMTILSQRVRPRRMWRNLLLADMYDDHETQVFVECHTSRTGGGSYDVRVRGPHAVEAMMVVASTLSTLFEGMRVVERFSVQCLPCGETHQIARADVSSAVAQLRPYFVCPNGYCIRVETIDPTLDLAPFSHRALRAEDFDFLEAEDTAKGKDGAILRRIPLEDNDDAREAWVRASLVHKNIVPAVGIVMDSDPRFLMYRMMPLGRLDQLLQDRALQVEWRLMLRIARDICEALRFAHNASPPVVHGSLRAACIMLGSLDASAPLVAKVYGFALSEDSDKTSENDVFGFGSLMVELLTRDPIQHAPPVWCPAPMVSLIRACQRDDRASRPTFREVRAELAELEATTSKLTIAQMLSFGEEMLSSRDTLTKAGDSEEGEREEEEERKDDSKEELPEVAQDHDPAPAALESPKPKKRRRKKKVRLKRGSNLKKKGSVRRRSGSKAAADDADSLASPIPNVEVNITGDADSDEPVEIFSAPPRDSPTPLRDGEISESPEAVRKSRKQSALDDSRSLVDDELLTTALQEPSPKQAVRPTGPPRKPPKPESYTMRFKENAVAMGYDDEDSSSLTSSSASGSVHSCSESSSDNDEDSEGSPCLACRMEKNPIGCMAFVSNGGSDCANCKHPFDAHAVAMRASKLIKY